MTKKLLLGSLVVFGGILVTATASSAVREAWGPVGAGVAPASVMLRLSKCRYAKNLVPGDVRVIFAWEGLTSGQESALSWVRSEQSQGRIVLTAQSFDDDLQSGAALYSFPSLQKAQEALKGAFWQLPAA